MKKDKKIENQGNQIGWVIQIPGGFIDNGLWWLGGGKDVGIIVFADRKDAMETARKIRKQRPYLARWTKTIPAFWAVNVVIKK